MDKYKKEDINSNFIKKYPIIFKKYRPIRRLSSGVFSEIYSGINIHNNEKVAIKIEKRNIKDKYLESECYTLFSLRNIGIPKVLSFGHNKEYDILVMPLLGKSLLDIFISKNSNYEFKDICLIAIQIIERIQWVHSRKFIHRDIKPDNFLIGLNDPHIIYLIDFGLSKKYQSTKSGKHILYSESKKFTGTIVYGSVNSLKCREQSRRDDLESIGYMLIYFMKGRLPWQSVKVDNKKESYLKVSQMKRNILPEELCENLPCEFTDYMKYVKNLKFEENPNYGYLRNLFVQLMKKQGFEEGTCFFSWVNVNNININNIKRQINLSKRSSSRKRVINKIRRNLEQSHKSYSENKHDYFFLMKDICNSNINDNINNLNDNSNENDNYNNNRFNLNTKVKKFVDKKFINQALVKKFPNLEHIHTIDIYRKDSSIEEYKNSRKNKVNNNIVSINNNIIKKNIKNLVDPFTYGQDNLNNLNNLNNFNYVLTDNNLCDNNNNNNNNNYNNITNTIYAETNYKNNNNYIKLNSNNNRLNLLSSFNNNNHKRISSNNFPNKQKKNINNNNNNNKMNNNSNSYIYKKKNIIIINNNIYPNNPGIPKNITSQSQNNNAISFCNTVNNDRTKKIFIPQKNANQNYNNIKVTRDKNLNDKNIKIIKLFNIFSPKKNNQNISFQPNLNKKINKDIMKEITMFNQRYNNHNHQKLFENENFFKKIKVAKNMHTIKSSDNKKRYINNKIHKAAFHSPRNDNCIIF